MAKIRGTTLLSSFLAFLLFSYLVFLSVIPPLRLALAFAAYLFIAFLSWLVSILMMKRIKMVPLTEMMGWATLCLMSVVVAISFFYFWKSPDEAVFQSTIASSFIIPAFLWITGLRLAGEEKGRNNNYRLFSFMFIVFIGMIILGCYLNYRTSGTPVFFAHVSAEHKTNHLLIADTLAIVSLLFAKIVLKKELFLTWVGLPLALILFLAGSRTTLYLYSALFLLGLILIRKQNINVLLILIVALFPLVEMKIDLLKEPELERMIVLTDIKGDSSWQARKELNALGWEELKDSWLLGSFMGEVRSGLGKGTYAHNWISFWNSYGLAPFVLFSVLTILLIIKGIKILLIESEATPLLLILFVLGAILFSRGYIWPLPWLVFGYVVRR